MHHKKIAVIFLLSSIGIIWLARDITAGGNSVVMDNGGVRGTFFGTTIEGGSGLAAKGLVKNDFLVNDDITGIGPNAGCQYEPAIAVLADGEMMIVWRDLRDSWNYQIFGRCYDASGVPIGPEFLINDFAGAGAFAPDVGACGQGYVVSWCDGREGNPDIYIQRYDHLGMALGPNIMANDDGLGYIQYDPSVAGTESGFVVAWRDYRNGVSSDIYAQRYDAMGSYQDGNFKVNDGGIFEQYAPCVSGTEKGFVITWYNYVAFGDCDIIAQRYDLAGIAQGENFRVNDDGTSFNQISPRVTGIDSGFLVVWQDFRNGVDDDVMAQRYDNFGNAQGGNFRANDDSAASNQMVPDAVGTDSGFAVVWQDYRNWSPDIYAQRYDVFGNAQGKNIQVNDDHDGCYEHYSPCVSAGENIWTAVWHDDRADSGNYDIFFQTYGLDGLPVGANSMVNNDTGTADQGNSSMAMNTTGTALIVWHDGRNGIGSSKCSAVYGQLYDQDGYPLGPNFMVNDSTSGHWGINPAATYLPNGQFVVAWDDNIGGEDNNIYAQLFDPSGKATGANYRVDDDGQGYEQYAPCIAANDSGYMIAWQDYRNGGPADIYARFYPAGPFQAQGSNYIVNDDSSNYSSNAPNMAASSKHWLVCWCDNRSGRYEIYGQLYDAFGNLLGPNFRVNDNLDLHDNFGPSVAAADSGFVVAWQGNPDGHFDIYAQRYDMNGNRLGVNFKVNDDIGATNHYSPSACLSPDGIKMLITWQDYRFNPSDYSPQIMAQIYLNGIPQGENCLINDLVKGDRLVLGGRSAVCNDQRIFWSWCDNRRLMGMDIFAKLTDWDLVHIEGITPIISYLDSLSDDLTAPYGPYGIKAVVADNQALWDVRLLYQLNSGAIDTLEMLYVSSDTFTASIPALDLGAYDTVSVTYRIAAKDSSGNISSSKTYSFKAMELTKVGGTPTTSLPKTFALQAAYPNPSKGQTIIKYQLPKATSVKLQIYNIAGQLLKTADEGQKPAGYHQVKLNDNLLSNGVYFYQLTAGSFSATGRLTIIK